MCSLRVGVGVVGVEVCVAMSGVCDIGETYFSKGWV